MQENTRRTLLKTLTSLPIVGGAILAQHALLRFFKPTMAGGLKGLVSDPDSAGSSEQEICDLSALAKPWDYVEFIYVRRSVEYSSRKVQGAKIPAYIVRLPDDMVADKSDPKAQYVIVQRICPHLGCTFNFIQNAEELKGGYNYAAPAPFHPYFACPCHLSVYDPTRKQNAEGGLVLPGKVVSGPAPRPPRTMTFDIRGGKVIATGTEAGGVG